MNSPRQNRRRLGERPLRPERRIGRTTAERLNRNPLHAIPGHFSLTIACEALDCGPFPLRASLNRVDAQLDELIYRALPQFKSRPLDLIRNLASFVRILAALGG